MEGTGAIGNGSDRGVRGIRSSCVPEVAEGARGGAGAAARARFVVMAAGMTIGCGIIGAACVMVMGALVAYTGGLYILYGAPYVSLRGHTRTLAPGCWETYCTHAPEVGLGFRSDFLIF